MIEGTQREFEHTPIPRNAFQGALITLTVIFGLSVLRSDDPGETASLLIMAGEQLARRRAELPTRRIHKSNSRDRTQSLMLQAIPYIGPTRALALLDEFGDIRGVLNAEIKELTMTEGIGQTTAQIIQHSISPTSTDPKDP